MQDDASDAVVADQEVATLADHIAGNALLFDRQGSVSYTLLRPHETVLDLVCRLLLEKKKTLITTAT